MKAKRAIYNLSVLVFAAVMAFSGWQPVFAQTTQFAANGWFTVVWGDAQNGEGTQAYLLTDDNGVVTTLKMDAALAAPLGGIMAMNRQRVKISGVRSLAESGGDASVQVNAVAFENLQEGTDVSASAVTGSQPFITIMCKFGDVAVEPYAHAYFQNMYSNVYPGLDNYWQEVSYATANVAGSTAVGWYTLPHPRSYYFDGANWSFSRSSADCTAAADAVVNFTPYKGINLMFNDDLDGFAWGGSQCMTLDGNFRCWPMTWEPPWGYEDITVISHEMGHAFGLPHSSGPYAATYDSPWDVMSDGWQNCSPIYDSSSYGCLGQHTISYHKDMLGWIPPAKKYTAGFNTNITLTLEQLSTPQTNNYLMVKIPIGGSSTHYYTVEARRKTGYDVKLIGNAVIIHDVDTTRPINDAHVIDIDGNGEPADAGSQWTPGERFSDTVNGIYVKVLSATATGFVISIQTPSVFKPVMAGDGWVLESGENTSAGGSINAGATTFKLGDDAGNKQFRTILPFDTSGLPDNAVVTRVRLKIMKQGSVVGTDPFTTHGPLRVDFRKPYFGAAAGLEGGDFQAAAQAGAVGSFAVNPVGSWYVANIGTASYPLINLTGTTQCRLRFNLDDNNDLGADYVSFYSANYPTASNHPQLVVQYYVP